MAALGEPTRLWMLFRDKLRGGLHDRLIELRGEAGTGHRHKRDERSGHSAMDVRRTLTVCWSQPVSPRYLRAQWSGATGIFATQAQCTVGP